MPKTNWHSTKITEVMKKLKADIKGLSEKGAQKRLHQHGANTLPEDKRPSLFVIFWRQMKSPLVYVLLIAALITAVLREFVDTGVILAAVAVNASIGFWQEMKADQAFAVLKAMVKHKAHVLRTEGEMEVDASAVVPGDIIVLKAGDRIPADGRILELYNFEVNEAALTGESLPIEKQTKILPAAAVLAERTNMVFQGTTVARGKAMVVVVATGKDTAFGEIALLVHQVKDPMTPLQQQIQWLAKLLGIVAVVVTLGIFTIGVLQGRSIVEMFLTAVAVAVAAIPEGLIISLTVILAIGMRKLARSCAIVKRLLAAETLGSVSIICSDKTGTLTTGEMEVVDIWTAENLKVKTTLSKSNLPVSVLKALEIAVVGNEAVISNPQAKFEKWEVFGDPTPRALLLAGVHAGLNPIQLSQQFPEVDEIPFDSAHKWAATLHKGKKDLILNVRGAPEALLAASKSVLVGNRVKKLASAQRQAFIKKLEAMADNGERVVGVAYSTLSKGTKSLQKLKQGDKPPGDLIFVGLFGLKDPLRKGTKETIKIAAGAGIRTVMITGDHAKTAVAIGRELGLTDGKGAVLTGEEIDKLDDQAFKEKVKDVRIFARVAPKHKVRIVDAYHARGETVAMTGDGVNDAPALKAADIGVAVGTGTDVAKEAADVVLTDNNFKTIVAAVEGGRNIYENVKKVVAYLLSDSWTEIIIVVGSLVLGLPLPVLAAQILWVNLIEDSLPNMSLAFDPGESGVMAEPPRARKSSLMDTEMKVLVFGVGITTSLILFGLFLYLFTKGYDLMYIRTMVFVGLGINSLFYIYSIRSLKRFIWKINPFNNPFLVVSTVIGVVLLVGAVYIPFLQHLLRTVSLSMISWLPLIGLGVVNIILIELVKAVFIIKKHSHA